MGELTNTAPIGVTTEVEPNSSNYVQIASGRAAYATPDKFQYENNDTSISAVLSGSNNLFVACEHNWGTTWQTDSTSHWHSCSICNGKDNIVNHSGGTATCTEKPYAKAAVCRMAIPLVTILPAAHGKLMLTIIGKNAPAVMSPTRNPLMSGIAAK